MGIDIEKEIAKCSKCGKCRSVCPVFIETKTEGMVARGRVSLAEALFAGDISGTAKMRRYLWGCLKCLRCADGCPAAVDFGAIIGEARRRLGKRVGMPWMARVGMRLVTPRRRLFDFSVRAMALAEKVLPRRARGKVRHLPFMFFDGRGMPEIAHRSVLTSFDEYYGPKDAARKVALFLGCLVNYAYPEVALAMIKVLNHYGVGVYVPKGQLCCGTPALSLGDEDLAERLGRANAKAFAGLGVEAIVCGCASGGATLKSEYPRILGRENPLGAPPKDFSEYVAPFVTDSKRNTAVSIAWHDPCHLKFVQKIQRQPREILSKVGNFGDFEGADLCCGMGGVFSAFFHDLSMKIAARKTQAIENRAPDVLATGCSGCILQIRDRLSAKGSAVRVMHIAQVLAEAIDADAKGPRREVERRASEN